MPVILATQEAEFRRTAVQSPEFKPQYQGGGKKKKEKETKIAFRCYNRSS
jgi:hypothetical protein